MVHKQGSTPTYCQFDPTLFHKSTTTFSTPRSLEKKNNNTRKYLYNSQPSHSFAYIRVSSPGWAILDGNYHLATGLLVYAGLTDLADGYLARRFKMSSVLGTILDPAADKVLMTTLTITLTMQDLIPVPLAAIILGRDVLLSLSALYIRYSTLPNPTFSRYWDFSLPSAEVRPTTISKVNTALQLLLMGTTTVTPILPIDIGLQLHGLQWLVATTTIWSGLSYVFTQDAVRVVRNKSSPP